jgi:glyceraldehyde 3-phosphate dehydrogenase
VKNAEKCIKGSVKKVVFSDSPSDVEFTMVLGVNEEKYSSKKHNVVAASICDVIGTGPLLKKIDSEFGIKSGFLLTMHPWLFYQNLLDGQPKSTAFMDKPWTYHAIGRASVGNLIPKNTSVVIALNRILPDIANRLECMSYRVPTDLVSNCNYSLILNKTVDNDTLKSYLKSIVNKPIMGYTEEPLVSSDYKHYDYSLVIDGKWTDVNSDNLLRLVSWYDNEWGYSSRVLDVIKYISDFF